MQKPPSWILNPLLLAGLGCVPYRPRPLDPARQISRQDEARWALEAGRLEHPLLRPLPIDPREGLSPDGAAVVAVIANPELRAVRDQRAITHAQLIEAGLLPDPVLSLSRDVPESASGPGATAAHSTQLAWDLGGWLTAPLRRRAAKASQAAVDLEVAWQEWQVAESAKLSVYRLEAVQPQIEAQETCVSILQESLQALQRGRACGHALGEEATAAASALDAGRRALLDLRQTREREQSNLRALLGLPPGSSLRLKVPEGPRAWNPAPSPERLMSRIGNRLDLLALEKAYEGEDARLRAAVASQVPSIGLSLSRAVDTSNVWTRGTGVSFSLPFLNGNRGQIALQEATRQQCFDQYASRLQRARLDVVQACAELEHTRSLLQEAQGALPAIRQHALATGMAFRSGHLDLLTRNQAHLNELAQEITVAALQGALDELGVALELAAGQPFPSLQVLP